MRRIAVAISIGLHCAAAAALVATFGPAPVAPLRALWVEIIAPAPAGQAAAPDIQTQISGARARPQRTDPRAAASAPEPPVAVSSLPVAIDSPAIDAAPDAFAPMSGGGEAPVVPAPSASPAFPGAAAAPIAAATGDVAIAASDATDLPAGAELARFLGDVRRRLEAAKQYPPAARRHAVEGTAEVRFRLGADGMPVEIRIARSSRSAVLDGAALATVRRAGPFPPPPGAVEPLVLQVALVFELEDE